MEIINKQVATEFEFNEKELESVASKTSDVYNKICDLIIKEYGEKITAQSILPLTLLLNVLLTKNEDTALEAVTAILVTPLISFNLKDGNDEDFKNENENLGIVIDMIKQAYDECRIEVGEE